MRSFSIRHFAAGIAALSTFLAAAAQEPARDAPEQIERLEDDGHGTITVRPQQEGATVLEKRAYGGRLQEIRVTSGNSTYFIRPQGPLTSFAPPEPTGSANRAVQWEILQFEWGSTPRQDGAGAATVSVPPPSPETQR